MRGACSLTKCLRGSGVRSRNRAAKTQATIFDLQEHLRTLGFVELDTMHVFESSDELLVDLTRVLTHRLGFVE